MADGTFKIDVPINLKGGTSKVSGGGGGAGGGSDQKFDALIKGIKKLDKSIIATFDPLEILTQAFGDLIKLIQPLIRILSILFLVVFLPLLPLIMLLVKGIALLVKLFTGGFGNVAKMIGKFILAILLVILAVILAPIVATAAGIALVVALIIAAGALLGDVFIDLINIISDSATAIWEGVLKALAFIGNLGIRIWDFILNALSFIGDLGVKIWDFIKNGLKFIGNIGVKIWDFLKSGFDFIKNALKGVANAFISLANKVPGVSIAKLAEGGIVNKPTLALIGEAGPEAVIPLSKMGGGFGGMTININNPSVRNDSDIKKIANEVSRALQRQNKGRFSSS